jgi:hypothetical protein
MPETQHAECPVCGEVCALTTAGRFWRHPFRVAEPCAGSGREAVTSQLRERPTPLREFRIGRP